MSAACDAQASGTLREDTLEGEARGDIYRADCPIRSVLDHVGSRWGALVLVLLGERTHRFSELANRIGGVSEKMLAQTLRNLEHDGFVARTVHPTKPPKVEYSLTALGEQLGDHITGLALWIHANVDEILAHRQGG
jgi:DNA-binding HxlR family transcriptional regulator